MPPVITLTTDFGTHDAFVGVMKGVILGLAPAARIVDLTHEVPPQDVRAASYILRGAVPYFPPGTIHVAVVDPGVGTARRALVVATRAIATARAHVSSVDAYYVAPDNGLLGLVAPRAAVRGAWDASRSPRRLRHVSRTFHGRDVFAPIAAALACGTPPAALGRRVRAIVRLPPLRVRREQTRTTGEVVWIDRFGNLITNIAADDLPSGRARRREPAASRRVSHARVGHGFRPGGVSVTIGSAVLPLLDSYADAAPGDALALLNSNDLVEIAVNRGSATARLDVGRGARVAVSVS